MQSAAYAFITFIKNPLIELHYTRKRVTGLLSVFNTINKAVSNYGKQRRLRILAADEFEFWCPQRRPEGHNIAFKYQPVLIVLMQATSVMVSTGRLMPSMHGKPTGMMLRLNYLSAGSNRNQLVV